MSRFVPFPGFGLAGNKRLLDAAMTSNASS